METGPLIDDLPLKNGDFSVVIVFSYQRVDVLFNKVMKPTYSTCIGGGITVYS